MVPENTSANEVTLPASVFAALRRAIVQQAGDLEAIHALQVAGYEAGTAAARHFPARSGDGGLEIPEAAFWNQLTEFFSRRGWGMLTHQSIHEAVGLLRSPDWAEVDEVAPGRSDGGACSFTSGFLSGLLSALAGGPVAVLEVRCRARGDVDCTFAFGNAQAVHELYGKLLDGVDLDGAVSAL